MVQWSRNKQSHLKERGYCQFLTNIKFSQSEWLSSLKKTFVRSSEPIPIGPRALSSMFPERKDQKRLWCHSLARSIYLQGLVWFDPKCPSWRKSLKCWLKDKWGQCDVFLWRETNKSWKDAVRSCWYIKGKMNKWFTRHLLTREIISLWSLRSQLRPPNRLEGGSVFIAC